MDFLPHLTNKCTTYDTDLHLIYECMTHSSEGRNEEVKVVD